MNETVVAAEKVLGCSVELQNLSDEKLNWAKNNPSLCFFPWNTLEIRSNGKNLDITCCCNLDQSQISKNLIDDPFLKIKEQMLEGNLPDSCRACKQEEDNGGISERIKFILTRSDEELENLKSIAKVKYFELRINFSSICTLACRICDAASSSTYAKITKDFGFRYYEKDISENETYFAQIQTIVKENLQKDVKFDLHLMGGEPLLSKGVKKLLDWLVDSNYANKINLKITSSLAVNVDDHFLQQLDRFKNTTFIASIDSVGENYRYVRWPAQFSKIQNNLQYIQDFKQVSPARADWILGLHPVFSLNNIFYIKEYLNYWHNWIKNNKDKGLSEIWLLVNPLLYRTNYLDIEALPKKYRGKLKDILTECINHEIFSMLHDRGIIFYTFLKTTLEELDTLPEDNILWNLYLKHTAEFDVRTNTKLEILNKKFYNLLDQDDIDLYKLKVNEVKINSRMIIRHDYGKI